MARERKGHTLLATDLVHEAYIRLARNLAKGTLQNRAHFFYAAAEAMRRILVEHARRRARRGGGRRRLSITSADLAAPEEPADVLALEEAVNRLEAWDERLARVVRLRFYAGLSVEETGRILGLSPRTVKRDWSFARTWLYSELDGGGAGPPESV